MKGDYSSLSLTIFNTAVSLGEWCYIQLNMLTKMNLNENGNKGAEKRLSNE
jgi:hypothetical protein